MTGISGDDWKSPLKAIKGRDREGGFTFIELVAVIAIISIIAVALFPKLSAGRFRAESGARVVASDLMSARMEAMVTATSVTVGFSPGSSIYGFGADRVRDLSEIEGRLVIETGEAVTFNSLGEPVGLLARQAVTVSDGTDSEVVYVEPYTGLVSRQ